MSSIPHTQATREVEDFLAGEGLYGDEFSEAEIAAWYEAEREGYAGLVEHKHEGYNYAYHALNAWHGFNHLPIGPFANALGLGSAYGDEFAPLSDRIEYLTIVDPSERFTVPTVHGIPTRYVVPRPDGRLPFVDQQFDLICCLGVLHHIPNVSFVVSELHRVCAPKGVALIREPIVSMGDWRRPRMGLTRNERGIPLKVFRDIIRRAEFDVAREGLCVFQPLAKISKWFGISPYNSPIVTRLDALLARASRFNYRYHPKRRIEKFRPTSVFFVLTP